MRGRLSKFNSTLTSLALQTHMSDFGLFKKFLSDVFSPRAYYPILTTRLARTLFLTLERAILLLLSRLTSFCFHKVKNIVAGCSLVFSKTDYVFACWQHTLYFVIIYRQSHVGRLVFYWTNGSSSIRLVYSNMSMSSANGF